jgi:hypothetical protein
MTDAPDTPEERLAEYQHVFTALIGRERTDGGLCFRFRADPAIVARVRRLAALEKACCAFIDHAIAVHEDELWWETRVVDDPIAKQILDELYRLPDTIESGVASLSDRFAEQGLVIVTDDNAPTPGV